MNLKAAKDLDKPFKYLEHSKEEAEEIAHLYEINCKEGKSEFHNGKAATEAVLKNLKTAPRILHLSTHGFYLQNPKEEQWGEEEPLLLSGLALADANLGLKGQTDDKGDDGLLYAKESYIRTITVNRYFTNLQQIILKFLSLRRV